MTSSRCLCPSNGRTIDHKSYCIEHGRHPISKPIEGPEGGPSAEELEALPEGSIVLTAAPVCHVKMLDYAPHVWRSVYHRGDQFHTSTWLSQAATRVLYRGEGT